MAIQWTTALAVGVSDIDQQHQELFRRVNQLIEACNQGQGKQAVSEVLSFLESYVSTHFRAEEALMRKYKYPDLESHQAVHQRFVESLQPLKAKLDEEGPGLALVLQTNRLVVNWLTDHIQKMDKAVGAYIKSQS